MEKRIKSLVATATAIAILTLQWSCTTRTTKGEEITKERSQPPIIKVVNTQQNNDKWTAHNRNVKFEDNGEIYMDAQANPGILWFNGSEFSEGTIELDLKGKDVRGRSFIGVVFHGLDNNTYDAIYFRPFNFHNPERNTHSVQYISMPDNDWYVLRESFPDKYENVLQNPPAANDWFSARIVINTKKVVVYVNGSDKPELEVELLSDRGRGKTGLWVGNGSDGWFRGFKVLE